MDERTARRRVGYLVTLLLIIAVLIGVWAGFAYKAAAQACATYEIGRLNGTSHITGRNDVPGIQVSLEGHYLWVNLGAPADPLTPEADVEASHDVSENVTGATVCPDGSVSFASVAAPTVVDAPADEPAPVEVDEAETQPAELVPEPVVLSDEIPWAPMEARVS